METEDVTGGEPQLCLRGLCSSFVEGSTGILLTSGMEISYWQEARIALPCPPLWK